MLVNKSGLYFTRREKKISSKSIETEAAEILTQISNYFLFTIFKGYISF